MKEIKGECFSAKRLKIELEYEPLRLPRHSNMPSSSMPSEDAVDYLVVKKQNGEMGF